MMELSGYCDDSPLSCGATSPTICHTCLYNVSVSAGAVFGAFIIIFKPCFYSVLFYKCDVACVVTTAPVDLIDIFI